MGRLRQEALGQGHERWGLQGEVGRLRQEALGQADRRIALQTKCDRASWRVGGVPTGAGGHPTLEAIGCGFYGHPFRIPYLQPPVGWGLQILPGGGPRLGPDKGLPDCFSYDGDIVGEIFQHGGDFRPIRKVVFGSKFDPRSRAHIDRQQFQVGYLLQPVRRIGRGGIGFISLHRVGIPDIPGKRQEGGPLQA